MKPHGHRLRLGRFSEPGRIYLVTAVTRNRKAVFHDLYAGRLLVEALRQEESHARTLAYVVMPDHFHWLMQLNDSVSLSRVVHAVKSISAHRLNRHLGRKGPFWQKGFHDHAVRREQDIRGLARYVVANPLRAGLAKNVGEYSLWDACWLE